MKAWENRKYLLMRRNAKQWFLLRRNKWKYRKTHVYRGCPHCHAQIRLPRVKGDHRCDCPKCGEKLTIDERFHGCKHYCKQTKEEKSYCYRCGEEIVEDHQHCSATGHVALCSATPEEDDSTEVKMPATHCNKCGAELTVDERFHGVPHTCKK